MRLVKALIAILLTLSLSGCMGKIFSEDSFFAPKPFGMEGPSRDADPIYLAGWDDGCQTGMSTMVMSYYKNFYEYTFDHELSRNATYYKAWKDAYTYCRQYAFKYTWAPVDEVKGTLGRLCVICPNEYTR